MNLNPPSIDGDAEMQALYDDFFLDKPYSVIPRQGVVVPHRPTPLKRISRNDPGDKYYWRKPDEPYDRAYVQVQPVEHRSEPIEIAAWARVGFCEDAHHPCYAPSQILALSHLSQVGSMRISQNMQNQQDIEEGKGPGGENPIRYQADFHPATLKMVAAQDAARKRDLDAIEDGKFPQVHCPPLPKDFLERGSFEVKDSLLSCYGYVKPEETYVGGETRDDDDTWLSTTPIALQHNASLVNCALAQNNSMHYACDNVMAMMEVQSQDPYEHYRHPTHLHVTSCSTPSNRPQLPNCAVDVSGAAREIHAARQFDKMLRAERALCDSHSAPVTGRCAVGENQRIGSYKNV